MSEWIEHGGWQMPVQALQRVEVRFRDGLRGDPLLAGDWDWSHSGRIDDIVAYRVVEDA